MEGLVSEAESMIEDTRKDSYTRDAGLILAAQKAEHYEIASYGTLKVFAEMMGETEIARELGMEIHAAHKDTRTSNTVYILTRRETEGRKEE